MSKRKAETQQDQQIVCKDCSGGFTFTVREQTAFAAKGFQAKVRCADCTKAKKVRRARTARTLQMRTTHALHADALRTGSAAQRRAAALAPHWHRTCCTRTADACTTHSHLCAPTARVLTLRVPGAARRERRR